jgi:phosphate transport system substrate-binding protein
VFDKRRGASVDFVHFGVQGTGRRHLAQVLILMGLAAVWVCDCSPKRAPGTVEDTQTSGRISVVSAPQVHSIIAREVAAFDSLYPDAQIAVRGGSSREAVEAMFAARCDLVAIARDLEPEERSAAVRGKLELEGYRFARDAVAVVVHPSNPVENIALEDVRGIYQGVVRRWDALGGARSEIEPVIQPPGSDMVAYFEQRVMNGEAVQAAVVYEVSDSGVVEYISRHPGSVGFVSLAWAERGVKALRLAALRGLPYWRPDAETVYRGDYPLTRHMNLYARSRGPALAKGLITYITSREGQMLVHDGGLVPTSVPVRFVRRSPMLGSHK